MYEDDDNEPDLDRYDTAAGYQPPDPYAKQREEARKALAAQSSDSMLETRPAGEWIARRGDRKELPSELYRSFWNEGELAILFGGKGSGKSVLAVQIAQSIALSASKVLYLDFQRTKRQWTERYTAPSLVPGKLPVRHRFPPRNFIRAGLDWDGTIPDDFKNDADHFMRHSVLDKLENTGARILIVDDILWLGRNTARVMKTLKFWATAYDLSILVLAPMKPRRKRMPVTLEDIAGTRQIAELADSVFAIQPSTFGSEYRYVKHLASPRTIIHDTANVLTYKLERSVDTLVRTLPSPVSSLPSLVSPAPFLGLTDLGPSVENDHLRDYAREALELEERERKALLKIRTRSARTAIAESFLTGEYARYLKG